MKTKTCLFIMCAAISLIYNAATIAQENVQINKNEFKLGKEGYKDAKQALYEGDEIYSGLNTKFFKQALPHYLEAYKYNPENPELNYKLGVCYLFSSEKNKAYDYLIKAQEAKPTVATDLLMQIGRACQYRLDFDAAIDNLNRYKQTLDPKRQAEVITKVDKMINECEGGKALLKKPERVFIDILGEEVNSEYPDYCPVITTDESVLIFTSRRPKGSNDPLDPADGKPYEDLYESHSNDKKTWTKAVNMTDINTEVHDAVVALSPDGQQLFTYKGIPDGTIFISTLKGDKWSKPKKMNSNINTRAHETAVAISADLKKLYVVSDREKDGFGNKSLGGKDIFVCEKTEKGDWGPALNIGAPINTEYDEDAVFMHPDGVTMYFSSKRQGGMGGYDIFSSTLGDDKKWGEPVNIGYPINTPDDDIFFVAAGNPRYAYYASDKTTGYGGQDIYKITFLGPEKLLVMGSEDVLIASSNMTLTQEIKQETVEVKKVRLTIMKGVITDALSQEPIEASIEIVDNVTREEIAVLSSNSKTGKYLVSLPSGRDYGIAVKADGYLFYSENINIPEATGYQEVTKDIVLSKIGIGSKIVLKNIFFDYAKATLRPTSFPELDRLVALLTSYPNMTIEIGGHTDSKGSLKVNTTLSENRAKAVVDYLINKGISQSRMSYKGYAFSEPIATNDTEEGRQQNRRVEFKVISIK